MKKLIGMLMCLGLILTVFAGCGGTKENSSASVSSKASSDSKTAESTADNEENSETASVVSEGNSSVKKASTAKSSSTTKSSSAAASASSKKTPLNVNLNGAKFTVIAGSEGLNMFPSGKGSTNTQKAMIERVKKLESSLNCTIKSQVTPAEEINSTLFSKVMNNEKYADIIILPLYHAVGYINSKNIVPLDSISSLDLKSDYMNFGKSYENTSLKGKHFFVGTEDMYFGSNQGVYFNKRLLKELKLEDPYTLVKNNKWTISKMSEMAKIATQEKDGKVGMTKEDQWGMICTDYTCAGAEAFFSASGGKMFTNNNGNISYIFDTTANLSIIDKANQFFVKDQAAFTATSNDAELFKMFTSGKGLFLMAGGRSAASVADMDDDFGFVPFPRGDNQTSFIGTVSWNMPVLMVPRGLSDAEMEAVGALIQAFGYLSSDVSQAKYDETGLRYFRESNAAQMLKTSNQSQILPTSSLLGSLNLYAMHTVTYQVFYSAIPGSTSAKAKIESNKTAAITSLNDLLAKIS